MKAVKITRKGKSGNLKQEIISLTDEQAQKRKKEHEENDKERLQSLYIQKRNNERGSVASQLEYLVENGVDAFIARDMEIRARHPKPSNNGKS